MWDRQGCQQSHRGCTRSVCGLFAEPTLARASAFLAALAALASASSGGPAAASVTTAKRPTATNSFEERSIVTAFLPLITIPPRSEGNSDEKKQ